MANPSAGTVSVCWCLLQGLLCSVSFPKMRLRPPGSVSPWGRRNRLNTHWMDSFEWSISEVWGSHMQVILPSALKPGKQRQVGMAGM